MVTVLGILSSVISVILTSVLLAEIAACLPLSKENRIKLVVVTCYSVGLGAVLTPLGEPLSTILVQKLAGAPFYAGFTFPFTTFAKYVIPGIVATAIFGAIWIGRKTAVCETTTASELSETPMNVIMRATKVFAFVAALVLLGEGLKPLIVWFLIRVSPAILFWTNMISAILDNATLTAMEISSGMMLSQIICIIMGLLIAGGMLIPGNIPNIVAAGKLKISMKEWAIIGVPIGLVMMAIYFVVLLPIIFQSSSG
jgi:predicted cation transporter